MKTRTLALLWMLLVFAGTGLLTAEEKFGVKVYDGAQYDADTSQVTSHMMKTDAACYRTTAKPALVNDFYKKQPGVSTEWTDNNGGTFKKGGITITVRSPWFDMKNRRQNTDTLISLVKSK